MENKLKIIENLSILLVVVFSIVNISAIGAGGVPEFMEIYPGQTIDKTLSLQNLPAGEGDMAFKILVDKGSEYISVVDEQVDVADGGISSSRIKISVPESAVVGEIYNVKIDFKTSPISSASSESEETAVQFSLGTSVSFEIRVIEKPAEPETQTETPQGMSTGWIVLIIAIVLAVIIILYLLVKKKK